MAPPAPVAPRDNRPPRAAAAIRTVGRARRPAPSPSAVVSGDPGVLPGPLLGAGDRGPRELTRESLHQPTLVPPRVPVVAASPGVSRSRLRAFRARPGKTLGIAFSQAPVHCAFSRLRTGCVTLPRCHSLRVCRNNTRFAPLASTEENANSN